MDLFRKLAVLALRVDHPLLLSYQRLSSLIDHGKGIIAIEYRRKKEEKEKNENKTHVYFFQSDISGLKLQYRIS
jgi:hypothetical protein